MHHLRLCLQLSPWFVYQGSIVQHNSREPVSLKHTSTNFWLDQICPFAASTSKVQVGRRKVSTWKKHVNHRNIFVLLFLWTCWFTLFSFVFSLLLASAVHTYPHITTKKAVLVGSDFYASVCFDLRNSRIHCFTASSIGTGKKSSSNSIRSLLGSSLSGHISRVDITFCPNPTNKSLTFCMLKNPYKGQLPANQRKLRRLAPNGKQQTSKWLCFL